MDGVHIQTYHSAIRVGEEGEEVGDSFVGAILYSVAYRSTGNPGSPQGSATSSSMSSAEATAPQKMDMKSRGDCIIINYETFLGLCDSRKGAKKDAKAVESTFERLGFRCQTYEDKTSREVRDTLKKVAERREYDGDLIVCVIMTHGSLNKLRTYDGTLYVQDIMMPLLEAETLRGKQKLFFVQACQVLPDKYKGNYTEVETGWAYPIPSRPDIFAGFATPPGYVAWRHPEEGSVFIQTLCKVFDKYALDPQGKDLIWLMSKVNLLVATEFSSTSEDPDYNNLSQMPCFVSCLTKKNPEFQESTTKVHYCGVLKFM